MHLNKKAVLTGDGLFLFFFFKLLFFGFAEITFIFVSLKFI